ncbi:serum amyloid P-component-like [Aulostomus maculatus]
MERLLLLMLLSATSLAVPRDLSGKVFIFPREGTTDYVKLLTPKTSFSALTVCLSFRTDLSRNYALFSCATPSRSNDFVLFKTNSDGLTVHAREAGSTFMSLTFSPNTWHTLCSTWSSSNGLAQLWVNGKPTIKRFILKGQPISGNPIAILGQEQDSYGGRFSASQSFLGMISRFHAWDYVLSAAEIGRYVANSNFSPGNVFNWRALDYEISGQVSVEDAVLAPSNCEMCRETCKAV